MGSLLEIIIDFILSILGIKWQNEASKGNKLKTLFLGFIIVTIVAIMGVYSIIWIINSIKT
jgi:glycerol uptake facilitator-like aquaporin